MVPADVYEMHGMECRGRVEEHLRYQGHEGTLGGFNVQDTMEAVRIIQVEIGGIKAEVEAKIKRLER